MLADPLFLLAALFAVLMLGLAKGGFAGIGMISTPLLALTVPPLQAAAILLPILIVQDVISVWAYRHEWSAWNLKVMLPGAVIGVGIAWAIAAYVPSAFVLLLVGIIGIAFVLNGWFRHIPVEPKKPSALVGFICGIGSGFTSTIIQAGSSPFQVHVLPQRLPKPVFAGTNAIFFALINLFKLVPYFSLGQFTGQTLEASAALLPLAVAANFLGLWLVRRTPTELFYRIAYVLVFLISLELTRRGAMALWRG